MRRRKQVTPPGVRPANAGEAIDRIVANLIGRDHPGSLPGTWVLAVEYADVDGRHMAQAFNPVGVDPEMVTAILQAASKRP